MTNSAIDVITPKNKNIFRVVFLYVGQGDSAILAVPDENGHKYIMVDSHQDEACGGIDLVMLLDDLLGKDGKKLDVFINTHPHKDHLGGIGKIYEEIGIKQLWHSGHKPGSEHKDVFEELKHVIDKLGGDNVFRLRGSRDDNKLDEQEVKVGKVDYNVLAPADYVSDDIEDEKPSVRYSRIHEQCGVVRFKYGADEKQILFTGDADYDAWKEHIAAYHQDRLLSAVLSAAHHGSNSFFWKNPTEGDPYTGHLDIIKPKYIVVSAPKQSESRHGHPDKEAMSEYAKVVGEDSLLHLGANRECIVVDIDRDGNVDVYADYELVRAYGKSNGGGGNNGKKMIPAAVSSIDRKPMGNK